MITTSAPGSLMIMGEHAVLAGHDAIVAAIDKRITVKLYPREDKQVRIASLHGNYESTIDELKPSRRLHFVIAAIRLFQHQLTHGCCIVIENQFDSRYGLGSSAAVLVATVKALSHWLKHSLSLEQLWQYSYEAMQAVQGTGSGADLAASILGGVVHFKPVSHAIPTMKKIADSLPLAVVYSGYKTPTVQVIAELKQAWAKKMRQLNLLFRQTNELTQQALPLIQTANWPELGDCFNQQFKLQRAMGISDERIDRIIHYLNKTPAIYGSKISGSGRGDCVIGLGKLEDPGPLDRLLVYVFHEGVQCEE